MVVGKVVSGQASGTGVTVLGLTVGDGCETVAVEENETGDALNALVAERGKTVGDVVVTLVVGKEVVGATKRADVSGLG